MSTCFIINTSFISSISFDDFFFNFTIEWHREILLDFVVSCFSLEIAIKTRSKIILWQSESRRFKVVFTLSFVDVPKIRQLSVVYHMQYFVNFCRLMVLNLSRHISTTMSTLLSRWESELCSTSSSRSCTLLSVSWRFFSRTPCCLATSVITVSSGSRGLGWITHVHSIFLMATSRNLEMCYCPVSGSVKSRKPVWTFNTCSSTRTSSFVRFHRTSCTSMSLLCCGLLLLLPLPSVSPELSLI